MVVEHEANPMHLTADKIRRGMPVLLGFLLPPFIVGLFIFPL
jgi:hypothetical protein